MHIQYAEGKKALRAAEYATPSTSSRESFFLF
ncbi:MAG: hypothetical protein JWL63_1721 [Rhodocyclales bacterium]|nr:hypothetical protein [Rhodocyclales bacterium]